MGIPEPGFVHTTHRLPDSRLGACSRLTACTTPCLSTARRCPVHRPSPGSRAFGWFAIRARREGATNTLAHVVLWARFLIPRSYTKDFDGWASGFSQRPGDGPEVAEPRDAGPGRTCVLAAPVPPKVVLPCLPSQTPPVGRGSPSSRTEFTCSRKGCSPPRPPAVGSLFRGAPVSPVSTSRCRGPCPAFSCPQCCPWTAFYFNEALFLSFLSYFSCFLCAPKKYFLPERHEDSGRAPGRRWLRVT